MKLESASIHIGSGTGRQAALSFAAAMTCCGMLRPVRDAMILEAGPSTLATIMLWTLVATTFATPAVLLIGRLLKPRACAFAVFMTFGVVIFFACAAQDLWPSRLTAQIVAVSIATSSFFITASFWAGTQGLEYKSTAVRTIASAGSAGAAVGPLAAFLLSEARMTTLALLSIVLLCLAALGLPRDAPAHPDGVADGTHLSSPWIIVLFILLGSASGTFLYAQQLPRVVEVLATSGDRTRFFALAEAVSALLLLLCSSWKRARPESAAVTLAGCMVLLSLFPLLAVVFITLVARRLAEQFAARPARELAWRRLRGTNGVRSRIAVDALAGRTGDALAAGIATLLGGWAVLGGLGATLLFAASSVRLDDKLGRGRR